MVPCFPPPGRPMNVDVITEGLDHCCPTAAVVPPSILEQMAVVPEVLKRLIPLELVMTGGGEFHPHNRAPRTPP